MLLNSYQINKVCIAQTGLDMHLLWSYISPSTKKKAEKILNELQSLYGNNKTVLESEIIKKIQDIWQNGGRSKHFAKIILQFAKDKKLVYGNTYKELREMMGIKDYDNTTQEFIQKYPSRDHEENVWNLLEATPQNQGEQK
jgi:hypothetical protein